MEQKGLKNKSLTDLIMKKVSFLFLICFMFFLLAEVLWSIRLFNQAPVFKDYLIDDWVLNIMFCLCAVFGLIGSYTWYKNS